jgi:hypothetical protein
MAATAEQLKRMREARWSDPQQRQRLAQRNRARAKHAHKPGPNSQFTIAPPPKPAVETAHAATLTFLSELRLGLLTDSELVTRFREAEQRAQQLTRLTGPLATNASGEITQLRVDMLALQVEIQRRQLSRFQRQQAAGPPVLHSPHHLTVR